MTEELNNELCQKYPMLFIDKTVPPMKYYLHHRIACGSNWYPVVDSMFQELDELTKGTDYILCIEQVKSKFGKLRVSWALWKGETIEDAIHVSTVIDDITIYDEVHAFCKKIRKIVSFAERLSVLVPEETQLR